MYNKWFRSRIYKASLLLTLLLIIGVLGFRFYADYSWIDAIYMTIITVSTVGFGEVVPLDEGDKLFTVFLIIMSVVIVAYSISIITDYIFSKNNEQEIKRRKTQKMIEKLNGHIIICGYGRNGKQAVNKLLEYDKPFVIIEKDKEIIEKYQTEQILFIEGNANEDEVLIKAGIIKASCLICALPEDADNLFVVLSARQMNKNMRIISRASKETSYDKLKFAGADNVIMPDTIGGNHMASLVVVPDLIEFMDNLSIVGEHTVNIEEVPFEKLFGNQGGRSIRDIALRSRTGCTVIGYKSPRGEYLINPDPDLILEIGSSLVVLGRPEQIEHLNKEFNI
ncbi:potassium channel family protein [Aquimarina rhabdastrellae]